MINDFEQVLVRQRARRQFHRWAHEMFSVQESLTEPCSAPERPWRRTPPRATNTTLASVVHTVLAPCVDKLVALVPHWRKE